MQEAVNKNRLKVQQHYIPTITLPGITLLQVFVNLRKSGKAGKKRLVLKGVASCSFVPFVLRKISRFVCTINCKIDGYF
jgi:hypothetical protein